jgi:hypothetical protein
MAFVGFLQPNSLVFVHAIVQSLHGIKGH